MRVPLETIDVATPCPAAWSAMAGDDRVRSCRHCDQSVFDLSAMTRAAAEQLLADHGANPLCVRLFRRRDGTVVTADCAGRWRVATRTARASASRVRRLVAATIGFAVVGGCQQPLMGAVVFRDPPGGPTTQPDTRPTPQEKP